MNKFSKKDLYMNSYAKKSKDNKNLLDSVATQPTSNHLNSSIYDTNREQLNKNMSISK